jgi:hypothetical protein
MKRLVAGVIALLVLGALAHAYSAGPAEKPAGDRDEPAAPPPAGFGFGMDAASIALQQRAGAAPDYGTFWVGPWTLESGWGGPRSHLDAMRGAGVTPAIHYYYWGDDISPRCIEDGCWSDLHRTHKDQAGWQQVAEGLVKVLESQMQGEPVVILLETEFNKNGIADYPAFDTLLAEKARYFRTHYPNARIVLPFGDWDRPKWSSFDESMAASDYAGIQGMRGSTRHSESHYLDLYTSTLSGVRTLHRTFGKPVFITDIALSSYPEPDYATHQATALARFMTGTTALHEAGAEALLYRAWTDDPRKNTANWFGIAERHWGLTHPDGTPKPAAQVWIEGVQTVRAGSPPAPPEVHSTSFRVSSNVNTWWVEVWVDSTRPVDSVAVRIDDGPWTALRATDWGSWARSVHAPEGAGVVFRATHGDGSHTHSAPQSWLSA